MRKNQRRIITLQHASDAVAARKQTIASDARAHNGVLPIESTHVPCVSSNTRHARSRTKNELRIVLPCASRHHRCWIVRIVLPCTSRVDIIDVGLNPIGSDIINIDIINIGSDPMDFGVIDVRSVPIGPNHHRCGSNPIDWICHHQCRIQSDRIRHC